MFKYTLIFLLCIASSLYLITGCSNPSKPSDFSDNPVDTTSHAFTPPSTVLISGQINGSVITTSSVTFEWSGSSDVIAFSCQINGGDWSLWSEEKKITFDYLDEGQYTFAVKAKHKNGTSIEKEFPTLTFTVDAVKGPTVMFYPRKMIVNNGSVFRYDIKAEEVTGLFAAKLAILYPSQKIRIDSVGAGPFTEVGGGDVLFFSAVDTTAGVVKIEFARVGNSQRGMTGSGIVAALFCTVLQAGDADFVFNKNETVYRDTVNAAMVIRECINGKVVVK